MGVTMSRVTSATTEAAAKASHYLKIWFAESIVIAKACGTIAVNAGALWVIFRGLTAAMDDFWTARGALPLSTRYEAA